MPCNPPNLVLSERHPILRAGQARVEARARLQLERALGVVEGPDAGKGGIHLCDDRLGALLQGLLQRLRFGQRQADSGAERREQGSLTARRDVPPDRKDEAFVTEVNDRRGELDEQALAGAVPKLVRVRRLVLVSHRRPIALPVLGFSAGRRKLLQTTSDELIGWLPEKVRQPTVHLSDDTFLRQ